jgi:hypothetical protein
MSFNRFETAEFKVMYMTLTRTFQARTFTECPEIVSKVPESALAVPDSMPIAPVMLRSA